jgi:cell division protein ZapA (FtsZ GTPase activity inhibitor)
MRIEVLGTAFTIETDEDPEYVADIVDYYKTKVQEIRKSVSTSDPLKISILSGLLVIDELFRERSRDDGASASDRDSDGDSARDSDEGTRVPHSDPEEVARITDELIEKLNETLQATESHAQAGEHGHGEADTEGDPEDEADTDSERPS